MPKHINVALDGPAGVGKSTTAKAVAKKLGLIYVDTGALYRAVGVCVLDRGGDTEKAEDVVPVLDGLKIEIRYIDGEQHVFANGRDVNGLIRTPAASKASSDVSKVPEVRAFLLETQREIARENDCIMDGRDIGTVILPDASAKFFLTADPAERARRRVAEMKEKGMDADFDTVFADMKARDLQDSTRAVAPLRPAPDAVLVDSTHMSLEEVVDTICRMIKPSVN
ncbi:MAG: (d)CMP kinase [Clostridia bacterium]|nr:(d)CMP kinase [Clostridia bacterium]